MLLQLEAYQSVVETLFGSYLNSNRIASRMMIAAIFLSLFTAFLTFHAAQRKPVASWLLALYVFVHGYSVIWGFSHAKTMMPQGFTSNVPQSMIYIGYANAAIHAVLGVVVLLGVVKRQDKDSDTYSLDYLVIAAVVCFCIAFLFQGLQTEKVVKTPYVAPEAKYDLNTLGKEFIAKDYSLEGDANEKEKIFALLKHPDKRVRDRAYSRFLDKYFGAPGSIERLSEYAKDEFARVEEAIGQANSER